MRPFPRIQRVWTAIHAGCAGFFNVLSLIRGKQRKWVLASFVLTAGLLWVALRAPTEPTYEGRTLSEWLLSSDYVTARHRVEFAILSMGEAAVPSLKRLLRSGSKFERMVYTRTPQWVKWCWPRHGNLSLVRERALIGIHMLHWDPQVFTPELVAMITDRSEFLDLRQRAMYALIWKNADRAAVLFALNTVTNDPDPTVGQTAFRLLIEEKERQTQEDIARLRFARPDAGRVVMQAEARRQKPLWAPTETGLPLQRVVEEPKWEPLATTNRILGGR